MMMVYPSNISLLESSNKQNRMSRRSGRMEETRNGVDAGLFPWMGCEEEEQRDRS